MVSTIQSNRKKLGSIPFTVAARVAMQLGRESISSSIIAIIELVKNAYDADAENVNIKFVNIESDFPSMIIEDDGNGMTEKQLCDRWMLIGTQNKLTAKKSKSKKRILIGEKGLGRLGLDRLCHKTIIQSFTKSGTSGIELEIDWTKYEGTNSRLEKIKHDYFSITKKINNEEGGGFRRYIKGTRLALQGLKDCWEKESLVDLKRELSLLISPFAGINDFHINIESGVGWKDVDGNVTATEILKGAEWHIEASIDDAGQVAYKFSSSLYKKSYTFKPTNWNLFIKDRADAPRCGPLSMVIYFYPRKDVELGKLKFAATQIKTFLDSNQGIRIYRDNFRVSPYGQPNGEGDWLRLSYRRQASPGGVTQLGWRVGYNQVVGSVFINREVNSNLKDQTNREGIVESNGYYDLRAFAVKVIEEFEYYRRDFEQKRKKGKDFEKTITIVEQRAQESKRALNELKSAQKQVTKLIRDSKNKDDVSPATINSILSSAISEVNTTISNSQKAQKDFVDAALKKEEHLIQEKNTLGNLASLGILTASFGHETLASTNLLAINAKQLKRNLPDNLFMVSEVIRDVIEENLSVLVKESGKIETFANFALKNIRRDKRKRKTIHIDKIAKKVFFSFETSLEEKNIKYKINSDDNIPSICGFEIDWESIFVNFITNSVWAIVRSDNHKRKIRIGIKNNKNRLDIYFSDSGKGFEKGTEKRIFEPGFSTKRNAKGEVFGTGMGLAIVKNFVDSYDNASINCKSSGKLGGAEFHISIPLVIPEKSGGK